MADPRYNNAIAGAAYLIGLTPAELIECLWLASEKKEIRTVSGLPIGRAKRSKYSKYITLTLQEAVDILAFLRKERHDMPKSVRER